MLKIFPTCDEKRTIKGPGESQVLLQDAILGKVIFLGKLRTKVHFAPHYYTVGTAS